VIAVSLQESYETRLLSLVVFITLLFSEIVDGILKELLLFSVVSI